MNGIVVLAAGASTRMGAPKQDLVYEGKTLLQRAIHTALAATSGPVVLVLGASIETELPESLAHKISVVYNPEWQEGMGSSIRCGLAALRAAAPEITGCLFMVCDQPYVDAALLKMMQQTKATSGKGIVACRYQDTLGTPVLFDHTYFEEISRLNGQEGAKKLLFRHQEDVAPVAFERGAVDIDTPQDYEHLKSGF